MTIEAPNIQRQLNKGTEWTPAHQMRLWALKPKIFMEDCFDWKLDLWQEEVVELYMNNQRIGLIASKGPGKTCVLSLCGWHFFLTKKTPKMAALSISKDNLQANLWAELLMHRSRSRLATKSTRDSSSRITLNGHEGYSFIDARAYPKNADEQQQASVLAGLHADNVMFLIDEGGTIPDGVFGTADAALSTGDSKTKCAKLMAAANPERPSGVLYRASKGRTVQKWAIYHISGDPDDPKRAPRVSVDWAREQIATHGRDHPWVMINVLAQYPTTAVESLLSEDEIEQAMKRKVPDNQVNRSQHRMGVDVARGGVDNTCMARRRGLKAYPIEEVPSTVLGPELAGKITFIAQETRLERVFVDDTGGYGSSVVDSLGFSSTLAVTPVKFNAKAQDTKRYFNKRTEMWVRMRDWVRKGGALPNDPKLAEELTMPKIFWHGGIMKLEEKDQIKKRLNGRSPDRADALALTFGDVEEASFYGGDEDPNENRYADPTRPHEAQGRYISDESQQGALSGNPNYRA